MRLPKRRLMAASLASLALAVMLALATGSSPAAFRDDDDDDEDGDVPITVEVLEQWLKKYSNWGRWHNELGAANFITNRVRRDAAKLVKRGISVGLAHPLLTVPFDPAQPFLPFSPPIPNPAAVPTPSIAPLPTVPLDPDNGNPFFHWMNPLAYTSDRYNVSYHGTAHSHIDALCHFQFDYDRRPEPEHTDFRLFNGLSRPANNTPAGCARLGIENLRDGIVTRGVLFDATLLHDLREPGYPWLAPGTRVTKAHLEELEEIEGVRVQSGDVILLYTGRWARRAKLGPWPTSGTPTAAGVGVAGYYVDTVPFMYRRQVSFIGHDEWNDVAPGGFPTFANLPIHVFAINVMGVDIFDNLDLEKLAQTAKSLRRYEFLFATAPSPVTGGTGSPLNPVAIF